MCSFSNAGCYYSAVIVFLCVLVASVDCVIDAIAAKQRAGDRRTFDDAAKATLRCIMRCYGYERFDNPSAQLLWLQTYSAVKYQDDFLRAAWILLEHILIFPDRRGEYWEMHHRPDRVKAARCGIDGMKSDVLKLQREIRAWQEEVDQRSIPPPIKIHRCVIVSTSTWSQSRPLAGNFWCKLTRHQFWQCNLLEVGLVEMRMGWMKMYGDLVLSVLHFFDSRMVRSDGVVWVKCGVSGVGW